jgi:hypothetical protein
MTIRLPVPGSDDGDWGDLLNAFLEVSHDTVGNLLPTAVTAAGAGTYSKPSGGIPSSDLDLATQTSLSSVASHYVKPADGIPGSDIASGTITDANISASAAIARTMLDSSTQASLAKADSDPTTLAGLTDVSGATGATNSQVLAYNTTISKWTPSTVSSTTVSDATTGSKGIIQLAGDLGGTAAVPTLIGTTNVEAIISANVTVAGATQKANNLSDVASVSTARTNLGLGSAATISATAGGDLSGTLPSPTVAKVNGVAVTGTPTNGQVLTASSSIAAAWTTPTAGAGNATTTTVGVIELSGDLAGTATSPSVAKINGITLPSSAPTIGNVLTASSATATDWATPAAGVTLDATAADIKPLGTQTAGAIGKAADAGHVHAMPRLDQVIAPAAAVALNAQKITGLANGIASTDAAAYGQITTYAAQATTPLASPVTGAYTASAGDFVEVNAASGAITIKLPNAPTDKSRVAIKLVSATSTINVVTILTQGSDVFDVSGGATSATLILQNQTKTFQYVAANDIWYGTAADLPLSSLVTGSTRTVTAAYTLAGTDHVVLADATSAAFTVTLPTAVSFSGRYTIDAITTSTNLVTLATTSSQTIDGASTTSIGTQASGAPWSSVDVISDGSNWRIV